MLKFNVQKRSLGGEQPQRKTILVVAAEARVSTFLVDAITQRTSYTALAAKNLCWTLEIMKVVKPDVFLFDAHALQIDNISLSDHFQSTSEFEAIPALVFRTTNVPQPDSAQQYPGLLLPFELDALLQAIEQALAQSSSQKS